MAACLSPVLYLITCCSLLIRVKQSLEFQDERCCVRAQVTGLALSPRHPYMFSCGLDKQVKCWDLEYNKVKPLPLELRLKVHSLISPHTRLAQTNPALLLRRSSGNTMAT